LREKVSAKLTDEGVPATSWAPFRLSRIADQQIGCGEAPSSVDYVDTFSLEGEKGRLH